MFFRKTLKKNHKNKNKTETGSRHVTLLTYIKLTLTS